MEASQVLAASQGPNEASQDPMEASQDPMEASQVLAAAAGPMEASQESIEASQDFAPPAPPLALGEAGLGLMILRHTDIHWGLLRGMLRASNFSPWRRRRNPSR